MYENGFILEALLHYAFGRTCIDEASIFHHPEAAANSLVVVKIQEYTVRGATADIKYQDHRLLVVGPQVVLIGIITSHCTQQYVEVGLRDYEAFTSFRVITCEHVGVGIRAILRKPEDIACGRFHTTANNTLAVAKNSIFVDSLNV